MGGRMARKGSSGRSLGVVGFGLTSALFACSGDSSTDPLPGPLEVQSVVVTSPIDTVMAAGWATQLSAEARDDSGETISTTDFVWRSSNANAATVSSSGVVDGLAPGTSTIEAEAGDAAGFLRMQVVPADLPAVAALLGDSFTEGLVGALGTEAREAVGATLEDCLAALDDGHILNLHACLAEIPGESATEPTDQVLLAVIGVIAARSDEFLGM